MITKILQKCWKIVLFVILIGLIVLFYNKYVEQKNIAKRQLNNVFALHGILNKERKDFIFRDSLNGTTVRQQEYTIKEWKQVKQKDTELIEELGLKLKRVEGYGKISMEAKYKEIKVPVFIKDSIKCGNYKSKWLELDVCIEKDSIFTLNKIICKDSIIPILYREPKFRIFGISFGTKSYELKLVNFNPNSNFTYSEWIKVSKKKK